jgi:hypothetical protein
VSYRVTGSTYTVKLLAGLAIVNGAAPAGACDAPQSAITAAWEGS